MNIYLIIGLCWGVFAFFKQKELYNKNNMIVGIINGIGFPIAWGIICFNKLSKGA